VVERAFFFFLFSPPAFMLRNAGIKNHERLLKGVMARCIFKRKKQNEFW